MRIGRDADADVARALDAAATLLPSEQRQRAKHRRREKGKDGGEAQERPASVERRRSSVRFLWQNLRASVTVTAAVGCLKSFGRDRVERKKQARRSFLNLTRLTCNSLFLRGLLLLLWRLETLFSPLRPRVFLAVAVVRRHPINRLQVQEVTLQLGIRRLEDIDRNLCGLDLATRAEMRVGSGKS